MIPRALSVILEIALSQRCETAIRRLYKRGSANYFVNISTGKTAVVLLSGRIGKARRPSSGRSMPTVTRITSIIYSTLLSHLGGESFKVLGSQPNEEGVIVTSRINGVVPMGVDWQLSPTDNGHKLTNLFVGGINMASLQHSVQRNSVRMQALLAALREKEFEATASSDKRPGAPS